MKILKYLSGLSLALGLAISATSAMAQWAPNGSLTIEVGFAPGGSTDTMGRVIAQVIEENTGWNVIVENRPGAGGVAMFTRLSQLPADGQIVGLGVSAPFLTQLVARPETLPFNLDSFEYLASITRAQVALVASKNAPFDDLAGMVAKSKEEGIAIAFGSDAQKKVMEYIAANTGANFRYVATKGAAETLPLILGGQVLAGFATGEHVQYLQTGDMKMIMSLNNARHDYAPGVETILEAGQDIFLDPIIFLATTAGLPNDAKEALQKAFDDAMASDKVKEIVRNASQSEAINIGPKELRTQMDAGMASMKKLLGK